MNLCLLIDSWLTFILFVYTFFSFKFWIISSLGDLPALVLKILFGTNKFLFLRNVLNDFLALSIEGLLKFFSSFSSLLFSSIFLLLSFAFFLLIYEIILA